MKNKTYFQCERLSFNVGQFHMRSLSLGIEEGEYFVLTGPNGSGKTVLVKLIAGLLRPSSGDIRLAGKSIISTPPWKRHLGYVPQDGLLFPNRTVRQNIAFGLEVRRVNSKLRKARVERVSELVGVSHLLDRMPKGLSGGERQKVSLARALVLEPSVLLLDEPVSSVDEDARNILCTEIRSIQQRIGVTTIHISHNSQETQIVADRVGVMVNGTLRHILDPAEMSEVPVA